MARILDDETETLAVEVVADVEEQDADTVAEVDEPADDDDAEVVVSIGDEVIADTEDDEEPSSNLVNKLRKLHRETEKASREKDKRIRELEAAAKPEAEKAPALGVKPTLEGCDYDEADFETKLAGWFERKREADAAEAKAKDAERAEAEAWQERLAKFEEGKKALKVRDYDDADDNVRKHFSVIQQGIIIQGSDNPALLRYAIGKNPEKVKELAAITDPVKFSFAVAKLETQLKVSTRNSVPPPEKVLSGKSGASGAADRTLDRLRAEAEKTGNYTKIREYKAAQRAK